jgi:hypothetical protein
MMMQAFSDDSSGGDGDKTLLLAGCVQKYTVWADFSIEWEAALATAPRIEYFKMREARSRINQFDGWTIAERDAKVKKLAELVARYKPIIISAWVSRTAFNQIVEPVAPYLLRHPYLPVFYALIIKRAEWQHGNGETLPTDFIFDEQGIVGAETVVWYSYMKGQQAPHIAALMGSTPIFRDDKWVLPLQAADMAAWHMRRQVDNPSEDSSQWPTAALDTLRHTRCELKKEFLTSLAQEMAAEIPANELVRDIAVQVS